MARRNIRPDTLDRVGAPPQAPRYAWGFMRPPARAALAAMTAICTLACGSRNHTAETYGDDGGDDAGVESGGGPMDSPVTGDDGAGEAGFLGDGATASNCDPAASLVYVATEERDLYSFDPKTNTFKLLWAIDCASGHKVNSMAVDRNAVAWINYFDGSLWKVDTKTGTCTATGFTPGQSGVVLFGMGFAAKTAGGNAASST